MDQCLEGNIEALFVIGHGARSMEQGAWGMD